ncbi:MAG: FAD-dependent oxidoreductase [Pseudomonadota bacterium]
MSPNADHKADIAIVGAGMAGASLAAVLVSGGARVLVLEAEHAPGYHATGRSAAFWTESYGGPGVQPLTTASGPALRAGNYLTPRGALTIARAGQEADLSAFADRYAALGVRVERMGRDRIAALVPRLRAAWSTGVFEPDCCDIDVARLHQDCIAVANRGRASFWTSARVVVAERLAAGWRLQLQDGRSAEAGILVNAAGAWADQLAAAARVAPVGITPYRRTVAQLAMQATPPASLPLVLDLKESFYFKPQAGRLWLSPHDETPSLPCDAAAEELDVAVAVDRLEGVVDWKVKRVEHRWAGLRSFAPDRLPVYGFAPGDPRFFWFAGQGGFGIQTAPAAAALAGALLLGEPPSAVDPAPYSPGRFT